MRQVLRLEHPETKRGVYQSDLRSAFKEGDEILGRAPMPDYGEFRDKINYDQMRSHNYGWSDLAQANAYCDGKLHVILDEIIKLEIPLDLAVYEVPHEETLDAASQVMFRMEHARSRTTIPINHELINSLLNIKDKP